MGVVVHHEFIHVDHLVLEDFVEVDPAVDTYLLQVLVFIILLHLVQGALVHDAFLEVPFSKLRLLVAVAEPVEELVAVPFGEIRDGLLQRLVQVVQGGVELRVLLPQALLLHVKLERHGSGERGQQRWVHHVLPQLTQQPGFLLHAGQRVLQQGVPRLAEVPVEGLGQLPFPIVVIVHLEVVLRGDPSKHRGVDQGLREVLVLVAVRHHPGVHAVPALRPSHSPPNRLLLDGVGPVHLDIHREQRRGATAHLIRDVRRRRGVDQPGPVVVHLGDGLGHDRGYRAVLGPDAGARAGAAQVNVVGHRERREPVARVAHPLRGDVGRVVLLDALVETLRREVLAAVAAIGKAALPSSPFAGGDAALQDVPHDLHFIRASRAVRHAVHVLPEFLERYVHHGENRHRVLLNRVLPVLPHGIKLPSARQLLPNFLLPHRDSLPLSLGSRLGSLLLSLGLGSLGLGSLGGRGHLGKVRQLGS